MKYGTHNLGYAIQYVDTLNILSGTINSIGGFWVDDTLNMSGGTVNIDTEDKVSQKSGVDALYVLEQVKITGGNLNIKANGAAIFVTGNKENGEEDGIIIDGGNLNLSSQSDGTATIFAGRENYKKNIIINGGNITLSGNYGVYTKYGVIKVNGFDSLNVDGIKTAAFKVAEKEGNEIIYADADYSKVDEAIEAANKLNKADYKDFSAVEKAIAAVVRGKNVLEQEAVDAMAKTITDAINSLELIKSPEKDNTPKTGVEENLSTIITFIALGALVGIVKLSKKQ